MSPLHLYTIKFTLLLYFVPNVLSIKCWDCRSSADPKCADPFDNTTVAITDCNQVKVPLDLPEGSWSMCQKNIQKVNGILEISRGCAWKRQDDNTKTCLNTSNGTNEMTYFCETCNDRDGCNGATTIRKTLALLLAPLGLLLFK